MSTTSTTSITATTAQASNLTDSVQTTTTDGTTQTGNSVQVYITQFFISYGPSLIYVVLSSLLVSLSVYMQTVFATVYADVQINIQNIQMKYMNQAANLYSLSLQYANGIIGVDSNSFLMNMDLPKSIALSPTAPVTLPNTTTTIEPAAIKNVMASYSKMFQGSNGSRIVLITNVNNVISMTIPDLPNPVTIPNLGNNSIKGDWFITSQGLPTDNYIYLINNKLKKTYIIRCQNNVAVWFEYKDDNAEIYVTMSSSNTSLGNKEFMLTKNPPGIIARPKPEDVLGMGV